MNYTDHCGIISPHSLSVSEIMKEMSYEVCNVIRERQIQMAQPVAQFVAQPVAQFAAQPVAQFAAQPVAQFAAQPIMQFAIDEKSAWNYVANLGWRYKIDGVLEPAHLAAKLRDNYIKQSLLYLEKMMVNRRDVINLRLSREEILQMIAMGKDTTEACITIPDVLMFMRAEMQPNHLSAYL